MPCHVPRAPTRCECVWSSKAEQKWPPAGGLHRGAGVSQGLGGSGKEGSTYLPGTGRLQNGEVLVPLVKELTVPAV